MVLSNNMNTNIKLFITLIGLNVILTIATQKIYICGKDKHVWITIHNQTHFKIHNTIAISFNLEITSNESNDWNKTIGSKNDIYFDYKEGIRYKIQCFNESNNQLLYESYMNSPINLLYDNIHFDNTKTKVNLNVFGFKNITEIKSFKMCMIDSIPHKDLCEKVNQNWKHKNFKNDYNHSQSLTKNVKIVSTELFYPCDFITINSTPIITEPSSHTLIGLLQTQEGHQFYINFNHKTYTKHNTIQYNCLISDRIITNGNIDTDNINSNTQKSNTVDLMTTTTIPADEGSNSDTSINSISTDKKISDNLSNKFTITTQTNNDSNQNSLSTMVIGSSSFVLIALLLFLSFFIYRFIVRKKTSKKNNIADEEAVHLNSVRNLNESKIKTEEESNPILDHRIEETTVLNNTKTVNNVEDNTTTINNIKDILGAEHANIPTNFGIPITTFNKTSISNNINSLPYEFNRVKLESEDYINASYIPDYNSMKQYIATQHPQVPTKNNFLNMIKQENINVIVMLTSQNEILELEDAYSSVNQIVELYGTLLNSQDYIDFNVKEFEYKHIDECRKIIQIQYTQWEENGIPNSPHNYVNFIKFFRNQKYKSPIIIHCSTGVDKTGDFILCNYLLDLHDNNQELDYKAAVIHLRKHRLGMINQALQYKFCHYVVKEALKPSRKLTIENFASKTYNDADLTNDLEYISNDPIDLIYTKQKHPLFKENKHQNRNKQTVLGCKGFLYLHPTNDYINANKIYHCGKSYICTQQPLKETVGDFWRLIDQEETQLILVLQEVTDTNIWPDKNHLQLTNYLQISPNTYQFGDHYDEIKLKLSKSKVNKVINLMYLKSWKQNSFSKLEIFINFILQSINNDYTKITIVCSDGSKACGIYLSFLKVLEQIKLEQAVDFCRAISMLRMYRSDFVNNLEQLQFLYDVTKAYLNNDHEYATID